MIFSTALLVILGSASVAAFRQLSSRRIPISMEYIPDGLTKEQWKQIKEQEAADKKNLALMGTTKFKSRSFEAWQKAGAKHLFPVDPKTSSYEERPYMQRKDGDWEGNDLKKLGLQPKGQGLPSERNKLDALYEKAEKEGKLNSPSIFGLGGGLPWTQSQANAESSFNPEGKQGARAVSTKKLSEEEIAALKSKLAKVSNTQKDKSAPQAAQTAAAPPAPAKKLFGLF